MERQAAKVQKTSARGSQVQTHPVRSSAAAHPMLELQRSIGNSATQRLIRSHYIQTKLQVSTPGDPFEQEADRVADTVMRMPDPQATVGAATQVQAKPLATRITRLVQRAAEQPSEAEKAETVATNAVVQRAVPIAVREDDEEEKIAPKLDTGLLPQEEEEEKTVATKLATDAPLQRQAREDDEREEETLQTSPIQRQTEEEEEEKVQTKSLSSQLSPSPRIHPVHRSASVVIQRLCTECEEEKQHDQGQSGEMVQRKSFAEQSPDDDEVEEQQVLSKGAQTATPKVTTSVAANIHAMNGGGSPLSNSTRAFFEPRFGADFSHVRVYTDSRATQTASSINAKAFTVGHNIAFGTGQYTPESREGMQVLAHELTHVVQQNGSQVQPAQPRATGQAPQVAPAVEPEVETKRGSEGPDTGFSTSVVQAVQLAKRGLGQGEGIFQRIDARGNSRKGRLNFLSTPSPVRAAIQAESGSPLADGARWSAKIGADVRDARLVPTPAAAAAAQSIDARAFTVGNPVFFGAGEYAPETESGRALIQYELVHEAQQRGAAMPPIDQLAISSPSDAFEVKARHHQGGPGSTDALIARDVPGTSDARPTAKPKVQRVGLEDRIRQVLQRNVTAADQTAQKQRREDLMELFRSIASPDREILRARLAGKPAADDDLAQLFHYRLSRAEVTQVVAALSGSAVPVPESRLGDDMNAFVRQLTPDKVLRASQEPVLVDDAWMRRVDVTIAPDIMLTPPPKVSGGVTLRWQAWRETKVVDVPVQSGSATWSPSGSPRGSFTFTIDTPGQWVIEVKVLRQGALLKQLTRKLQARAASGAELAGSLRDKQQIADPSAAIDAMSDAELEKQEGRLRRERAAAEDRDPGDSTGDRAALDGALRNVEWARFERKAKPPDKLTNVISDLDFDKKLPDDPLAMRTMFERLVITHGVRSRASTSSHLALDVIQGYFRKALTAGVDQNSPRGKKILTALSVMNRLLLDISALTVDYEKTGIDVMKEMLKASEAQLTSELQRYGMEWGQPLIRKTLDAGDALGLAERKKMDRKGQMEDLPDTRTLETTIKDLKNRQQRLTDLEGTLANLTKSRTLSNAYYQVSKAIAVSRAELESAWNDAVETHPILARFRDKRYTDFTKLAAGDRQFQGGMLFGEAQEIATNIAKAKQALDDKKFSVYDLPKAAQIAKLKLQVVPGSWRDVALNEQTQWRADMAQWKAVLKTVFVVSISLLAAAPTAGGSLLQIGVLMLDAEAIYEGIDKYRTGKAAGKSSLDPRLSLSDADPSFAWVVIDCVAAGIDAAQLVGMLRQAKRLRDLAGHQEVGTISAEARELSEVLNQLGDKGGLKYKLGNRILKEGAGIEAAALGGAHAGALGKAHLEDVAKRLGTTVEIEAGLGSEIRVHFRVDEATKHVHVTGIRVGVDASVADILLHKNTIKLLERYNGAVGKVRGLWDDFKKLFGGRGSVPFPPGSEAFNSWHEVGKLPEIIDARRARLGAKGKGTLSAEADAALREDIQFLENEYAYHKNVIDRLVLEKGEDFVAKGGNVTAAELKKHGYPPPPSKDYYYVRSPAGSDQPFYLRRVTTKSGAPPKRVEFVNGKPTGKFIEGEWTRAEKAERLVQSWDKPKQKAFEKLKQDSIANYGKELHDVVPIKGIATTERMIGDFVDDAARDAIERAFAKSLKSQGVKNPVGQARLMVNEMLSHRITVIKGTDQLRAFNYRAQFLKGADPQGDLHHWLPLYLGGHHRALIDMMPEAHQALHGVIDKLEGFADLTLAPGAMRGNKALSFQEGAAILFKNGSVELVPL
jgi:hypothetical protein